MVPFFCFYDIYKHNIIDMSHCNRRKLMINEEEKVAILSLYGLMTEQAKPSAVQSKTGSDEMNLTGQSFFDNGKWKNMSAKGKQELDSQLNKAAEFLAAKKGRVVYVKINAGESQVTNHDNEQKSSPEVDPGYLSQKRAETMKTYLTKYFEGLKSQGIIGQMPIFEAPFVKIGETSYTKGKDNPNDPKYVPERFVDVELKLQSPEKCVVGLTVEVMYIKTQNTSFPCRGGHRCDEAKFAVKLNGVKIGEANLNNSKDGGDRTSGKIVVTDAQAKQIIGNQSKDIIISLQCLSGSNCHSSTPEIRISKEGSVIYWGCSPSIAARGETGEKTILVLDNCGNLKQKGADTGNKGEATTTKTTTNATTTVKPTGKVVEFPIGVEGDVARRAEIMAKEGQIKAKPESDGTYLVIKQFGQLYGISLGDKLKLVKKPSISFTRVSSPDTPESLSKRLITNQIITPVTDKSTLTLPPQGIYKVLKAGKIANREFRIGDYVKFIV